MRAVPLPFVSFGYLGLRAGRARVADAHLTA